MPLPPGEHPRLFITKSLIPAIRKKLSHPRIREAWDKVLEYSLREGDGMLSLSAAPENGNHHDGIRQAMEANAFRFLLEEDVNAGRKAAGWMINYLHTLVLPENNDIATRQAGQVMTTCAMVYDWCYCLLDEAEKSDIIARLETLASVMSIGYPPVKLGAVTSHGSEAQLMRDQLAAGVAIFDEKSDMYRLAVERFFREYVPARNFSFPSNFYHQGTGYGPFRATWEMFAAWIFKRMGCGDVFTPEQGQLPYSLLYAKRPDGQLMRDGDNVAYRGSCKTFWSFSRILMHTASYFKDPYLHDEFLRQFPGVYWQGEGWASNLIEPVEFILFYDPEVDVKPIAELPLTRYFGYPTGLMAARTGWESGLDSPAVVAFMKLGVYQFNNHQHLDCGNFQIYYKGALAVEAGIYNGYGNEHDRNYNKRTIAHNCVLVDDPGEEMRFYQPVINDGGQRFPNGAAEPFTLEKLLSGGHQTGEILGYGFGPDPVRPDYSYLKGELTGAYTAKVANYQRSFVFLNLKDEQYPAVLIVFDRVKSADAACKKTWLLHSIEEPEIEGRITTIKRSEKGYKGKMVNTTVLPEGENTNICKIGGPDREFWVGGRNYPQKPKYGQEDIDEGTGWRIEISPQRPRQTDLFLNVLQVMDHTEGSNAAPVEKLDTDCMAGVKIRNKVVLFAKAAERLKCGIAFEVKGSDAENLDFLVADLAVGTWELRRAAEEANTAMNVPEEGGMLYFTAKPGRYELVFQE